jgi:hypothetical protein
VIEFIVAGVISGAAFALFQKLWAPLYSLGLMPMVATALLIVLGITSGWGHAGSFFGMWFVGYLVGFGLFKPGFKNF